MGARLAAWLSLDVRQVILEIVDDPIIAPSALKHGLGEDEIIHAYRNPVRVWDLGDGFTMIVGPNQAAMLAREKSLR